MCAIREFETSLNEIKTKGAVQGGHLQPRRSRAPVDRAGGGGGRHGVRARARRPHLRLASQPRRDSGQGIFRDPQAQRRRAAGDHADVPRRRAAPAGREGLPRRRPGAGGPLLRLRRVQRDLRARNRLQSRARRLDARVLRAVRDLSEQRDRRRLGLDRARARRCSSASIGSRASSSRTSATRRSAAARSGKASRFSAMDQYRTLWDRRSAAACRSSSTA